MRRSRLLTFHGHGDAKDVSASWVGECMIDCAIEVRDLQIAGIVEY